jgi:tRNA-uridine 2-sulfurtransferase
MVKKNVLVAMSGGVDSSVTAALLQETGCEIRGVYLIPWHASSIGFSNVGDPQEALASAQQAADRLGIILDVLELQTEFYNRVVEYFISGYRMGKTPNPCFICNKVFKWNEFIKHADRIGYDAVATGHYASITKTDDGMAHLYQAKDFSKDQSYVLSCLDQSVLQRALLPLGGYTKSEVRQIAEKHGFTSAHRSDSQDLCFLLNNEHKLFISHMLGEASGKSGPIVNPDGEVIGTHEGLENYTAGQRKGIRIAAAEPYYVLSKNIPENMLIVGPKAAKSGQGLQAKSIHWIQNKAPASEFEAAVKIRYHSKTLNALIIVLDDDRINITFHESVYGITPGQFAVIYRNGEVLGAAEIDKEMDLTA